MLNKGLFLACALLLLSACDSSDSSKPAAPAPAAPAAATETVKAQPQQDLAALAQRYKGRELAVADVSEIQLDGASALSVTFSVPLQPGQNFNDKLHLVDAVDGKVDGAWELSDNLMEARLRHLAPKRKLVLTVDAGLRAVNDASLAAEYSARLETRDLQPTVGFASRGSLLPTRLAEGLPVIALNVDKVDVEFFRVKPDQLPAFLSRWGARGMARGAVVDQIWPNLEKIAIDYTVAEPAAAQGRLAVIPGDFDWDDVGDFASVGKLHSRGRKHDLAILGENARVLADSSSGIVVSQGERLISLIGVTDIVVVDTPDALLVTTSANAQRVKSVVDALKLSGRNDVL